MYNLHLIASVISFANPGHRMSVRTNMITLKKRVVVSNRKSLHPVHASSSVSSPTILSSPAILSSPVFLSSPAFALFSLANSTALNPAATSVSEKGNFPNRERVVLRQTLEVVRVQFLAGGSAGAARRTAPADSSALTPFCRALRRETTISRKLIARPVRKGAKMQNPNLPSPSELRWPWWWWSSSCAWWW
jgi:hypothetical protein